VHVVEKEGVSFSDMNIEYSLFRAAGNVSFSSSSSGKLKKRNECLLHTTSFVLPSSHVVTN
jgi:hypothetical protein